jgi:hypothetical protein
MAQVVDRFGHKDVDNNPLMQVWPTYAAAPGANHRFDLNQLKQSFTAACRSAAQPQVLRRKLREMVQKDKDAGLTAMSASVAPEPLRIYFETVADLAGSLYWLVPALS